MARRVAMIALLVMAAAFKCIAADDPEEKMDAVAMIRYHGFVGEEYNVTTSDGYILGVQRIPCPRSAKGNDSECYKPRPVVFLQHGLLGCSTNWLTNLVNESFGYLLADHGFDVWLGNVRGSTYSRGHVNLTTKDEKYWEFSWDEHAAIDLPSMVNLALNKSRQKQLYYVGHSQGTSMGFAGFTENQTLAAQIKRFYALAPVTKVEYIKGLFKWISEFYKPLAEFLDVVGDGEFLPNTELLDVFGELFCQAEIKAVCGDIFFLIGGYDPNNLNESRIPVYVTHTPAGTSLQNVEHWAQLANSKLFGKYDYGSAEANREHYGQDCPPLYNVSALKVPTALYAGDHDYLADPRDVADLLPKIRPTLLSFKNLTNYEHLDFIWGLNANRLVYDEIIQQISEDWNSGDNQRFVL